MGTFTYTETIIGAVLVIALFWLMNKRFFWKYKLYNNNEKAKNSVVHLHESHGMFTMTDWKNTTENLNDLRSLYGQVMLVANPLDLARDRKLAKSLESEFTRVADEFKEIVNLYDFLVHIEGFNEQILVNRSIHILEAFLENIAKLVKEERVAS